MQTTVVAVAVVMLLAGCASSIMIHQQDSVALKTVKVTARVAEAIPTFGLVEVYYSCARDLCSAVNGACDTTPGVAARAWWACHDHVGEQFLAAAQTMNQTSAAINHQSQKCNTTCRYVGNVLQCHEECY